MKPKRLHIQRPLLRRRNQATKRDTSLNERFSQKYVPLLRNIGLLFNTLLSSTESEYDDVRDTIQTAYSRKNYYTDGAQDNDCPCSHNSEVKPAKETTASDLFTKISYHKQVKAEAATETADNTTTSDVSGLRQNQNVSLLFTRDSSSRGPDHHGVSSRGGAALHRSTKRNIARYNRDSEHDPGREGDNADAAFPDETTPSAARDRTSGSGTARRGAGNGTDGGSASDREGINATDRTAEVENATREVGGNIEALEDEDQLEIDGDAEEHSEPIRGRRGHLPEHQVRDIGESLQPGQDHEESQLHVSKHFSSNKSVAEGDGTPTTENQALRSTDEAMILRSGPLVYKVGPKDRKVVMIFDGYSVAMGNYGVNKAADKV